ncbi:MAG TPA: hypothetical protein VGL44_16230 [Gaiellales bacterium]|jgi:hypothetical protein
MNTMHNLGLPASECAKLVPARTAQEQRAAVEDIARAQAVDDVVPAPAARQRPTHHLSGFARA